ncbi:MAG: hypothetical protein ACREUW_12295 [Burkholderiales bacterium]
MSVLNAQRGTSQDRPAADASEDRMLFITGFIILVTAAALMATSIAVTADAVLAPVAAVPVEIQTVPALPAGDFTASEPVDVVQGF